MSVCPIIDGAVLPTRQNGKTLPCANLAVENAELRELVRDYEELAAALCDARECDGCLFDSEWAICEHMRLIARVGELGVEV